MIFKSNKFFVLVLLLSIISFVDGKALAFDEPMQSISTGNVTGVYYSAGSAIAKMHNLKRKEYNLRVIAVASEGSIANIENVVDGSAGFGITQANTLYYANEGIRYWNGSPQKNLRSVLGLYTEDFTIIAGADSEINEVSDLEGKIINIGEQGSTDALQAIIFLNEIGLDPAQDLTVLERPTYEAAELLQAGEIDAYFYTVGHPNLSVIEASAGERKVVLISPGKELIDNALKRSYLLKTDIPIDYYPELLNREPVPTISVKAIFFTHKEMDEQVVYNIVKEVCENFDLFKRQHPALAGLTKESLTSSLILPLHPGAERYYREIGLLP